MDKKEMNKIKLPPRPMPRNKEDLTLETKTDEIDVEKEQNIVSRDQNESATQEENLGQIKIKEQKNKTKKVKTKKLSKRARLIIILTSIVFVLLLAGGITAIILVNNANNKKLPTPTLTCETMFSEFGANQSNSVIAVLQTNEIEGATLYQFEVTYLSGEPDEKADILESSSNYLELSKAYAHAGEYSVRARVLGKGSGATSEYSVPVQFTNRIRLNSPKISVVNLDEDENSSNSFVVNKNLQDDFIVWEEIPNADKYIVRYGANAETGITKTLTLQVVDQLPANANETEIVEVIAVNGDIKFDLSNIYNQGADIYQVSVIAVSNNEFYLESSSEKTVTIEYHAELTAPINPIYYNNTKTLIFNLPEDGEYGNKFELVIIENGNEASHEIYVKEENITREQNNNNITITVNLSAFETTKNTIDSMTIRTIDSKEQSIHSVFEDVTVY